MGQYNELLMCVVRAAVSPWLERLEHIFRTALNPLYHYLSLIHSLSRVCNVRAIPKTRGIRLERGSASVQRRRARGVQVPRGGSIDCRVQTSDWAITFCWGVSFICAERGSNKRSAVLT